MLRPIQPKDSAILYDLFEPEKGGSFLDLPLGSIQTFDRWINGVLASELLGFCLARTILGSDRLPAGMIILSSIDCENQTAEMGTWLGKAYRGKGLNETAKSEILNLGFRQLELQKIILWISDKNLPATYALKKLPYVTLPEQEDYQKEKKHRHFLFGQTFTVYEIHRNHFLSY
ncbi:GNAT family N-acetyltransferase [Ammoniphilus sp. 3BR4]|uniref:GNAT family N-acetyltransferase n=1 Tax=Ammoniphilus sp. 3BR4 TaxID=3158265 RepID=UPI0034674FE1